MYSIYDYYGMQGDLDSRYNAAQNATSQTSLASVNNTPFAGGTTNTTTTTTNDQLGSLADYQLNDAAEVYSPVYTEAELANNPSPSWMGKAANGLWGLYTGTANAVVPGLGVGLDVLRGMSENEDYSWSDLLGTVARGAVNYGMGQLNPGQYVSGSVKGMTGQLLGNATNFFSKKAVNTFLDSLLGNDIGLTYTGKGQGGDVDSGYYDTNNPFYSPSGLTGDVDQGYYDNSGGSGDSGGYGYDFGGNEGGWGDWY